MSRMCVFFRSLRVCVKADAVTITAFSGSCGGEGAESDAQLYEYCAQVDLGALAEAPRHIGGDVATPTGFAGSG